MYFCQECGTEYNKVARLGRPGKATVCEDCSEETQVKYTGNMIYDHKTGCSIQINKSELLTKYISEATKLRNKGSNLGNNLKVSGPTRGESLCVKTVGAGVNYKGR